MTNKTVTMSRELAERVQSALLSSHCPEQFLLNELQRAIAAPIVEGQPYSFASVLIDTFQYAIDNGKQPTFSKGDLLYFIEQLGKCQGGVGQPVGEVVSGYSGDPDTRGSLRIRELDLSKCVVGTKLYAD